jgi:hypothetical protein
MSKKVTGCLPLALLPALFSTVGMELQNLKIIQQLLLRLRLYDVSLKMRKQQRQRTPSVDKRDKLFL